MNLRELLLRALVGFGVTAALLTEALGALGWLRPVPLGVAWLIVCVAAAMAGVARWRGRTPRRLHAGRFELCVSAAIAGILGIVALTALLSPPNSADAMAYHLPRVIYWAQSGSVAFFPTPYFNQVMLQPLNEYLMLHTYVLTGVLANSDRFINLITCCAFAGCIVGVSAVARAMGLSSRAQAFAALFCATLPNAILQASGAKNDMLLALWMVCAVYFGIRRQAMWLGLAVGLALATKGTAYLFLPPMLLALGAWRRREIAWMAAGVLLINTPQYVRNVRLSGSPLGYDSAQGDGAFRWRNEHPGWRAAVSNALRNTSEQLGARSDRWNRGLYDAVVSVHRALGIDPQDPDTTWRWARYEPPRNANHEANANNRWHLLLIAAAGLWAVGKRDRRWSLYAAGLGGAFVLFCFYLKWQPFLARLELPLFVLGAVLVGYMVDLPVRATWLMIALSVFLVNNARPALFENWTRPLKGPHSLWASSRGDDYFRDMVQWDNRTSYVESVNRVAQSGCDLVGLDISENTLEYPFQALLRERRPQVRFVHTGVAPLRQRPCAVLCLDCAGKEKKIAMYPDYGPPIAIGHFLLFR